MSHLIPPAYVTEGLVQVEHARLMSSYLNVYEDNGSIELTLVWTSDAQTFYYAFFDGTSARYRAIMELPGTDVQSEVILVLGIDTFEAYLVPDDARVI